MGIAAAAIACASTMLVAQGWVEAHLALRFTLLFVEIGVGIPCWWAIATRRLAHTADRDRRGREAAPPATSPDADGMRRAALAGAVFVAWAIVAAFASGHLAVAILGTWLDAVGGITVVAVVAAWALGVCAGTDGARVVTRALEVAVVVNAVVAVIQVPVDLHGVGLGLLDHRSTGLWTNPVFLSAFLGAGVWLLAHRLQRDTRWGAAIVLVGAALQVAGGRLGLVVLVVAVAGAAVALTRRTALALLAFLALGFAAGGALGAVSGHATANAAGRAGALLGTGTGAEGVVPRLETWTASLRAVAHDPIFGTGPALSQVATGPRRSLRLARAEGPDRSFAETHNLLLEYAVTTGVPGLLAFVVFAAIAFRLAGWRSPLAGFACLALISHLFQPNHAELTPLAFLALGAACATRARYRVTPVTPVALGAVALAAGTTFTIGAWALATSSSSVAAARHATTTARSLLPWWSAPYERTAQLDEAVASANHDTASYRAALSNELEAARREPYLPQPWARAGALELQLGEVGAAETDLRRALADDPWSVASLRELSVALAIDHRYKDALDAVDRALSVAPSDADLLTRRAILSTHTA